MESDLITRLRKRAEIRRQIRTRRSVQFGETDRIADILEEAAKSIEELRLENERLGNEYRIMAARALDLESKSEWTLSSPLSNSQNQLTEALKREAALREALEKYKHVSIESGISHFSHAAQALAANPLK